MEKNALRQLVWVAALVGLVFASLGFTTTVFAQDPVPVDPVFPTPEGVDYQFIPNTGGEAPVQQDEGLPISGGMLAAIFVGLFVVLIIALLIGDGFINRID